MPPELPAPAPPSGQPAKHPPAHVRCAPLPRPRLQLAIAVWLRALVPLLAVPQRDVVVVPGRGWAWEHNEGGVRSSCCQQAPSTTAAGGCGGVYARHAFQLELRGALPPSQPPQHSSHHPHQGQTMQGMSLSSSISPSACKAQHSTRCGPTLACWQAPGAAKHNRVCTCPCCSKLGSVRGYNAPDLYAQQRQGEPTSGPPTHKGAGVWAVELRGARRLGLRQRLLQSGVTPTPVPLRPHRRGNTLSLNRTARRCG